MDDSIPRARVQELRAQIDANAKTLVADIATRERELAQARQNHLAVLGALQALDALLKDPIDNATA